MSFVRMKIIKLYVSEELIQIMLSLFRYLKKCMKCILLRARLAVYVIDRILDTDCLYIN